MSPRSVTIIFKSLYSQTDLREEVLSRGGESFSELQSTPKRFLPSLKKNKVVPSPAGPATNLNSGPIFASLTYNEVSEDEGALSLIKDSSNQKLNKIEVKEDSSSLREEPPLDPIIIVKSNNQENRRIEERSTEGVYNTGANCPEMAGNVPDLAPLSLVPY